jgi:hypothetical protein
MSLRERLLTCLDSRSGKSYCASCITQEFGLSENFVYEFIRYLAWKPQDGITSENGVCSSCAKMRMVISAKNQPPKGG